MQAWNTSKDNTHIHAGNSLIKSHIETWESKLSPVKSSSPLQNLTPKNGIITKEINAPTNNMSTVKIRFEKNISFIFLF